MKKTHVTIIIVLVIILVALGFLVQKKKVVAPVQPSAPTTSNTQPAQPSNVSIVYPAGNEQLVIGQTYTLKWTGGQNPIDIFLVDDATKSIGVSVSLVDRVYHIQNTGSYSYTIPKYLKPGSYQLEIGDATSNEFQVVAK